MLKSRALRALLLTAPALLASCGSDDDDGSGDAAATLEPSMIVYTWLQTGPDAAGMDALKEGFEALHPETTVSIPSFDLTDTNEARNAIDRDIAEGNPPDLIHAVAGEDLLIRVRDEQVADIQALAEREGWADAFRPEVLAPVSSDGKLYGVPLNVEWNNTTFYNIGVFEEASVSTPDEWDSLEDLVQGCGELRAAGVERPLALIYNSSWTLSYLFFETILPATASPEFYEDYFAGDQEGDDAEIAAAADMYETIVTACVDLDAPLAEDWNWITATDAVAAGDAAMIIMPDWIAGQMDSNGVEFGSDYGMVATPGSGDFFVFASIAFAEPVGAASPVAAGEFLAYMGSAEGQVAFNQAKGSIPARRDVDESQFDERRQVALAAFQSDETALLSTVAAIAPADFQGAASTALAEFITGSEDGSIEPFDKDAFLARLRIAYQNEIQN